MPVQRSGFRPAWWLPGPHLQTLWPNLVRVKPCQALRRERLELPDGDFLDLDWTRPTDGPLVLVLHGLEGSIDSHYAAGLLRVLSEAGFEAVLMHFRGCSGEPNRLARSYHSGETGDLAQVLRLLGERFPERPMAAVGYSLGGNVLLKWLGESGGAAGVQQAVAVSVPFDLGRCADRLGQGFSRVYQAHLLKRLKRSAQRKFRELESPVDLSGIGRAQSFREFDDCATAPLHGFSSAEDYYQRCSSRPFLHRIRVPTLILHAADDPFMSSEVVPGEEDLSEAVTLELSDRGGHVGFVSGRVPLCGHYWLETRIVEHLATAFGRSAVDVSAAACE